MTQSGAPSNRELVVFERNTSNPQGGRLLSIPPGQATGIPLPTARVVNQVPVAGSIAGEIVYERPTRRAFIWDGSGWRDVAPSAILRYPDDAALIADTNQAVGSFAISGSTGNLYIYTANGWRFQGIKEYPNVAALLADNAVTDGDVGEAIAEGVEFVRRNGQWRPSTLYVDTEANILSAGWAINGLEAVASDTGNVFVRAAGQWLRDPIQHYPTETALLAATPPNGTLAWGDNNGLVYARNGGAWQRVNSPGISVGARPANPALGDLNYETTRGLQLHNGTSWVDVSAGNPVGTIIMYPSWTSPTGYMLCDGRAIPAQYTQLIALLGANTPDLRDQFIRGAASGKNPLFREDWMTGRPKTAFTGGTDPQGQHNHGVRDVNGRTGADGGGAPSCFYDTAHQYPWNIATESAGNHTHNVTINGGGDVETRPKNIRMAFHVKHD